MNFNISYVTMGLRAAAMALSATGNSKVANGIYAAADAMDAGRITDEHMALVAAKLKSRSIEAADWDEVTQRINDGSNRLQAAGRAGAAGNLGQARGGDDADASKGSEDTSAGGTTTKRVE